MSTWMIREDKLDDSQKEFINVESRKDGNIWIQGFAGSGKSILLVHHLRNVLAENSNITAAIIVYTRSLVELFQAGLAELGNMNVPVMTYHQFKKSDDNYDYLYCDEVQDIPADVLELMYARSGKLIVAGDSNQSIYAGGVSTSQIEVITKANAFALDYIHRLTKSIITAVQKLLPSMNIFSAKRDMTKQDVSIRLCKGESYKQETEYVYAEALKGVAMGEVSVVLLPHHENILDYCNSVLIQNGGKSWSEVRNKWGKVDYGNLNRHLKANGIKLQYVGNGYGSLPTDENGGYAVIMTYHSSKGLDFDNVFLPYMNDSLDIYANDPETLFMVAMTRSRKNLYVTYNGYTHDYVDSFKADCTNIDITNALSGGIGDTDNDDDFAF